MPDKWVNTVISSSTAGGNKKTFVFYQNDQSLKICLQRDGITQYQYSTVDWFMGFVGGLAIRNDRRFKDSSLIFSDHYECPKDLGYATMDPLGTIYYGGSNDGLFTA